LALTRRKLFKLAQWIFAAAVLFFAARSLATQWNKVEARLLHVQFGWQWIGAATVVVLLTFALLIEGWRRVMGAWDSHLPFGQAARIWFLSSLGKYVPGNIWSLTAMGVMARGRGISALAAAGSSIIMQAVSLVTGAAIVMITGAQLLGQPVLVGVSVLILIGILLSAAHFSTGRSAVSLEDVTEVALPVLRHRILLNFQAEADGIDADHVVRRLIDTVAP